MILTSISAGGAAGEFILRAYKIHYHSTPSQHSRSLGVTRPPVASLIRSIIAADGAWRPLRYRETDAALTPITPAKWACEMACSERNSESVMGTTHYTECIESQASVTVVVTDSLMELCYLLRMTELDRLLKIKKAEGISAAKIAKAADVQGSHLSPWRKGEVKIPDDACPKLAEVLGVTPFDLNPDYLKSAWDHIRDPDDRESARLAMKRAFRDQVAKTRAIPVLTPPQKAPGSVSRPKKNDS